MAKKKIQLNTSPLETVAIGDVKQNKYGWIGVILLFAFFLAVIYFLPEIENYYEKYIKKTLIDEQVISSNEVVNNNTVNEDNEEVVYSKYEFNYDTVIELNNLKYTSFSYQNNTISFTVVNSSSESIKPNNIFIELYDASDNLIRRIMLNKEVSALASEYYEYQNQSNVSYFYLKNVLDDDYTYIDVSLDDDGKSLLTCQNENETLTYTFVNDKLKMVEDKITYANSNADYDSVYEKYKTNVLTYSSTSGVTANIGLDVNGLVYNMKVDYSLLDISLNNLYYFSKDDSIRKVNFEMEAMFFDCK